VEPIQKKSTSAPVTPGEQRPSDARERSDSSDSLSRSDNTDFRERSESDSSELLTSSEKRERSESDFQNATDKIEDAEDDFLVTLTNSKTCAAFENFLEENTAHLLFAFVKDVENFKNLNDPAQVAASAPKIFKEYLSDDESHRKLSIEDDVLQIIKEKIDFQLNSTELFNVAQKNVLTMLEEVYFPLFMESKVYETLMSSSAKGLEKQLEEERENIEKEEDELLEHERQLKSLLNEMNVPDITANLEKLSD